MYNTLTKIITFIDIIYTKSDIHYTLWCHEEDVVSFVTAV